MKLIMSRTSWIIFIVLILILNSRISLSDPDLRKIVIETTPPASNMSEPQFIPSDEKSATVLNPAFIIEQEGYRSETHIVTTDDGYILNVYRIVGPLHSVPIFLQHGIFGSATDWLIPGRRKSLAFILSDSGYDVWLGNFRGNAYSKNHETIPPSDSKFWDFSWEEGGRYDLPACIIHIVNITQNRLIFISYSMGATMFSVMATERPDITNNIKFMIGLGPATYVHYTNPTLRMLSPFWKEYQRFFYENNIHEITERTHYLNNFGNICNRSSIFQNIFCRDPLILLTGLNTRRYNDVMVSRIWSSFPAGTSAKVLIHCLQQIHTNSFRKFDYGLEMNKIVYKSTQPPSYNLSNIRTPIAVFWSMNDWVVGQKDIEKFYSRVFNKLGIFKIEDKSFNHMDYLWAEEAVNLLYSKILVLLARYRN